MLIDKFNFKNIVKHNDSSSILPTKINILLQLKLLLTQSNSGDVLFFHYSGHGSYVIDRNKDEIDGYDEMIVSSDNRGIIDDELKLIIQTYLKKEVTLFALFDSCFSGSVLDLKYQYIDSLNSNTYSENPKNANTNGNVFLISGCTDEQTSEDAYINNKFNGAMTWAFLECINKNNSLSLRETIQNMRKLLTDLKYDQTPQLSSGRFYDIDNKMFL